MLDILGNGMTNNWLFSMATCCLSESRSVHNIFLSYDQFGNKIVEHEGSVEHHFSAISNLFKEFHSLPCRMITPSFVLLRDLHFSVIFREFCKNMVFPCSEPIVMSMKCETEVHCLISLLVDNLEQTMDSDACIPSITALSIRNISSISDFLRQFSWEFVGSEMKDLDVESFFMKVSTANHCSRNILVLYFVDTYFIQELYHFLNKYRAGCKFILCSVIDCDVQLSSETTYFSLSSNCLCSDIEQYVENISNLMNKNRSSDNKSTNLLTQANQLEKHLQSISWAQCDFVRHFADKMNLLQCPDWLDFLVPDTVLAVQQCFEAYFWDSCALETKLILKALYPFFWLNHHMPCHMEIPIDLLWYNFQRVLGNSNSNDFSWMHFQELLQMLSTNGLLSWNSQRKCFQFPKQVMVTFMLSFIYPVQEFGSQLDQILTDFQQVICFYFAKEISSFHLLTLIRADESLDRHASSFLEPMGSIDDIPVIVNPVNVKHIFSYLNLCGDFSGCCDVSLVISSWYPCLTLLLRSYYELSQYSDLSTSRSIHVSLSDEVRAYLSQIIIVLMKLHSISAPCNETLLIDIFKVSWIFSAFVNFLLMIDD